MKQILGFSLIEVLVALFLLSVALLGVAGLHLVSLAHNHSAYLESIASQQLVSMAERLRANQGQQLAQEMILWNADNQRLLPAGQGEVSYYEDQYLIVLSWQWRDQQTLAPACKGLSRQGLACMSLNVVISK